MTRLRLALFAAMIAAATGAPAVAVADDAAPSRRSAETAAATRNGLDIYRSFRDGLAAPECDAEATSPKWRQQFAHAPERLASPEDQTLPLFGYVVDEFRLAGLPTEFALIPFVESGYQPAARNGKGPAGLWQFIGSTARNHDVAVHAQYDGRLSPVDSTKAAVTYLRKLYGMFGGNWQLAVMAYNTGEGRVLQAVRNAGGDYASLGPSQLAGISPVTYAYVQKLHALSCVLEKNGDHDRWLAAMDRQVPRLTVQNLPQDAASLTGWARDNGHDPGLLARLNPALKNALWRSGNAALKLLAPAATALPGLASSTALNMADRIDKRGTPATPVAASRPVAVAASKVAPPPATTVTMADAGNAVEIPPPSSRHGTASPPETKAPPARHVVQRGESTWSIARQYHVAAADLIRLNGLDKRGAIKPGMELKLQD
jgi:membrane-bound lytic murein transglycosylase D